MSEYSRSTGDAARTNTTSAETKAEKIGRRSWARCLLWGVAIIAAVLLIAGTLAALLWCN